VTAEDRIAALERALAAERARAQAKEEQLARYAADLRETFKQERARAQELRESYLTTVRALANAVEARDSYTGKHAERVTAYGVLLAREAGLDLAAQPDVEFGFLLHDVGKVAVPDAVLFKPGRLTPAERRVVEEHPVAGERIVAGIGFLGRAREVIRHHHERWDGSGYPDGLAGDAIPLSARVFMLGDVLDALTTDRPYRRASPVAEARDLIERGAGAHFDPAVVEAFARIPDERLETVRREVG
jgi:HD-GYP domain-containing protein (c-di-GMP phosphodiesterase class II)